MEENTQDIKELFLTSFIGSLIENMAEKLHLEKKIEEMPKIAPYETIGFQPSIKIKEQEMSISKPQITTYEIQQTRLPKPYNIKSLPKPVERIQAPQIQSFSPEAWGRLTQIIYDPTVSSIECPGPGKNVIVNKFGAVQTTPVMLSADEINKIMQIISEKTRIPLVKGVFKAAVENFVITAIISEFIGTRFHIEKIRGPLKLPIKQ